MITSRNSFTLQDECINKALTQCIQQIINNINSMTKQCFCETKFLNSISQATIYFPTSTYNKLLSSRHKITCFGFGFSFFVCSLCTVYAIVAQHLSLSFNYQSTPSFLVLLIMLASDSQQSKSFFSFKKQESSNVKVDISLHQYKFEYLVQYVGQTAHSYVNHKDHNALQTFQLWFRPQKTLARLRLILCY